MGHGARQLAAVSPAFKDESGVYLAALSACGAGSPVACAVCKHNRTQEDT